MEKEIELLDWDSALLGFLVAKIAPQRLTNGNLSEILDYLRAKQVHLVYWSSESQDAASQEAAQQCGGFLADHKRTYLIDLRALDKKNVLPDVSEIYSSLLPSDELIALALESGAYSRFKKDPRITSAQFTKMYTQWITNSTNRSIAKQVKVIKKEGKIAAMATLGEKNQRGDIGLLAVAESFRGLKLGSAIVDASLQFFREQDYSFVQVVTQAENKLACRLYESRGFTLEKQENFYHFWL